MIDLFDDPILHIMKIAAEKAGELIRHYYSSPEALKIKNKLSHQDLVTQADTESQNIIVDSLCSSLKNEGYGDSLLGFIGEENFTKRGEYTFVIDPIDGTTNFTSKINNFAVSIGCFAKGKPEYGITYDPINDCLYAAQNGKGAYKITQGNATRLQMVAHSMDSCLLATYIHSRPEQRQQEMGFISAIYPFIKGVRIMGSGSQDLVRLADDAIQIVMFAKSNLWDIAAAYVVVTESGGGLYNLDGSPLLFDLSDPQKNYPLLGCLKGNESLLTKYVPLVS